MDREELNKMIGMTEEEMDAEARIIENDLWDPTDFGKPKAGRPTLFEEAMGTISFKEAKPKIKLIDSRAASMGLSRSDYLRKLVDSDLATIA